MAPVKEEEGAVPRPRRPIYSPLWQADGKRIRRVAPLDFIGRYMPGWFDYAICDEAHQLANDTAQGNGLGTLAACADRTVILTGTLLAATPATSTICCIGSSLERWPHTGTSGESLGCVLSPKPTACWKGSQRSSRRKQLLKSARHQADQAQASCLAIAVQRVPDEPCGLRFTGGHFG